MSHSEYSVARIDKVSPHSEYSVARIDKVSLACIRVYIVRNNLIISAPSDPRDLSLKDTRGGRGTYF